MRTASFCSFIFCFLGVIAILMGQAYAEGKGKLATCRYSADSGGETVKSAPP